MPRPPDLWSRDLDADTWHQPMLNDRTSPSPEPPQEDDTPITSHSDVGRDIDTPAPLFAPTPVSSPDSKDSADSDESTPRPGPDRSHEWDLLPPPTIEQGQVILGKYLLEKKIGEGGMGEVWLVENIQLERASALKLIKPGIAQNDKGWRRFEREARLMAKITHPHAVAVYDFKRTHSIGYIEMEFVRGQSLDKYLAEFKGQPMSLDWTAQILEQLCSLLQEAHGYIDEKKAKAKPIIHRDLKPSNLMLVDKKPPGENLKVLDFGIAKMIEDEGNAELTGAGDLVGTPAYMSPEQIRGGMTKEGKGEIDGRSDLYSVGVLLYQLLTGSLPFPGMNRNVVLNAHLNWQPPPMKEANPNARVPAQVERVVMSCLEKEPQRRPQTARELSERFRAAVSGKAIEVRGAAWKSLAPRVALCCVVIAASGFAGSRWLRRSDPQNEPTQVESPGKTGGTTKPGDVTDPGKSVEVKRKDREAGNSTVWESAGYEVLTAESMATVAASAKSSLEHLSSDLEDAPAGVRRKADDVVFYCFKPGIYLPLGYVPQDPKELEGFWPKVLVRVADQVKFIRISGGSYTQGDFGSPKPTSDSLGNPYTPHKVEVSDFYIQETEVTNKEIEDSQREHPDVLLERWKEGLDTLMTDFKKPRAEVAGYPAVCINRATAQRIAERVNGRLPTEAEWEYAARSGGQECRWAGKNNGAKKHAPKAHLWSPENAERPIPVPVRSFEGDDETDQKVFDMTGNVREWCLDVYKPYSEIIGTGKNADSARLTQPLHDPRVGGEPDANEPRLRYVARGGSFLFSADDAKTFQRHPVSADELLNDLGMRVVIECPPDIDGTAQ